MDKRRITDDFPTDEPFVTRQPRTRTKFASATPSRSLSPRKKLLSAKVQMAKAMPDNLSEKLGKNDSKESTSGAGAPPSSSSSSASSTTTTSISSSSSSSTATTTTTTDNNSTTSTSINSLPPPPPPPPLPVTKAFAGIANQGATCYMNSLLQTLFMTPEFRRFLYSWTYKEDSGIAREQSIPLQLQLLFAQLQAATSRAVSTKDLTKSFGWDGDEAFQQHDVQELARVLFDALESSLQGTENNILMQSLFKGTMDDYIKCQTCGSARKRVDTMWDMSLVIRPDDPSRKINSVMQAMEEFIRPEVMDGENSILCDKCGKKTPSEKGLKVSEPPYLLQVQLKRFIFDLRSMSRQKVNDLIEYPILLDMNDFVGGIDSEAKSKETKKTDSTSSCSSSSAKTVEIAKGQTAMDLVDDDDEKVSTASGSAAAASGSAAGAAAGAASGAGATSTTTTTSHSPSSSSSTTTTTTTTSSSTLPPPPRSAFGPTTQEALKAKAIELIKKRGPYIYELYSVLVHSGGAAGGHYYAYIRDLESNKWYNFNDGSVSPIDETTALDACGGETETSYTGGSYKTVKNANAYMLMYRRVLETDYVSIPVKMKRPAGSSGSSDSSGSNASTTIPTTASETTASTPPTKKEDDAPAEAKEAATSATATVTVDTTAVSTPSTSTPAAGEEVSYVVQVPRSFPTNEEISEEVKTVAAARSQANGPYGYGNYSSASGGNSGARPADSLELRLKFHDKPVSVRVLRTDSVTEAHKQVHAALGLDKLEWDGLSGFQDLAPKASRAARILGSLSSSSSSSSSSATTTKRIGVPIECIRLREFSNSTGIIGRPASYNPKPVSKSTALSVYGGGASSSTSSSSSSEEGGSGSTAESSTTPAKPETEDGSHRKLSDISREWNVWVDVVLEFRASPDEPWSEWSEDVVFVRFFHFHSHTDTVEPPVRVHMAKTATLAALSENIAANLGIPRNRQRLFRFASTVADGTRGFEYLTNVACGLPPLSVSEAESLRAIGGNKSNSISPSTSIPRDAQNRIIGDSLRISDELRITTVDAASSDIYVEEREPPVTDDFSPVFEDVIPTPVSSASSSAASSGFPSSVSSGGSSDSPFGRATAAGTTTASSTEEEDYGSSPQNRQTLITFDDDTVAPIKEKTPVLSNIGASPTGTATVTALTVTSHRSTPSYGSSGTVSSSTTSSNSSSSSGSSSFIPYSVIHGFEEVTADRSACLRFKQRADAVGTWKYNKPGSSYATEITTLDTRMTIKEIYAYFSQLIGLVVGEFVLRLHREDGNPLKINHDKPVSFRHEATRDGTIFVVLGPTPTSTQFLSTVFLHMFPSDVKSGTSWLPELTSFVPPPPPPPPSVPSLSSSSTTTETATSTSSSSVAAVLPPPPAFTPPALIPVADPTYDGWAPPVYTEEEATVRIQLLSEQRSKEAEAAAAKAAAAVLAAATTGAATTTTDTTATTTTSSTTSSATAADIATSINAATPSPDATTIVVVVASEEDHSAEDAVAKRKAEFKRNKADAAKQPPKKEMKQPDPRAIAAAKRKAEAAAAGISKNSTNVPDPDVADASGLFANDDDDEFQAPLGGSANKLGFPEEEEENLTIPPPNGKKTLASMTITLETNADDVRSFVYPILVRHKLLPEGISPTTGRIRVREMDLSMSHTINRPISLDVNFLDLYGAYISDSKRFAIQVLDTEEKLLLPAQPISHSYTKPPKVLGCIIYVQWFDRARWRLGKRREIYISLDFDSPASLWTRIQRLQGLAVSRASTQAVIRDAQAKAMAAGIPSPFFVMKPPSSLPPPPPPVTTHAAAAGTTAATTSASGGGVAPGAAGAGVTTTRSHASDEDDFDEEGFVPGAAGAARAAATTTSSTTNFSTSALPPPPPPSSTAAATAAPVGNPHFPVIPETPVENMKSWMNDVQYSFVLSSRSMPDLGSLPRDLTWRAISSDTRTFKELLYGGADSINNGTLVLWDVGIPLMERTREELRLIESSYTYSYNSSYADSGSSHASVASSSTSTYKPRAERALKISVATNKNAVGNTATTSAPAATSSTSSSASAGAASTTTSAAVPHHAEYNGEFEGLPNINMPVPGAGVRMIAAASASEVKETLAAQSAEADRDALMALSTAGERVPAEGVELFNFGEEE